MARIWQSVIFEDVGVQVSYFDEEERDESGMVIHTVVINPMDLKPEIEELFDSLTQLVESWSAQRREVRAPKRR